jgi:undecaprenyl-diphosphatase
MSCLITRLNPTISHVPSSLDHQLFLFLNADRNWPLADTFWAVLSSLDFWFPFFVLAGLLIAWRGGFRARAMLVCLLLSVGLMEGLFINPAKSAFGRPRPNNTLHEARTVSLASVSPRILALLHPLRIRPAKVDSPPRPGKSFPSGHTSNMFCFAAILTAFYGRRGALLFLPAALVAVSRVTTGSHWPSDVFFTAFLSVAITFLLLKFYAFLWKTFAPRLLPKLAAKHPNLLALPA